jgi:hypothetical protein
MSAVGNYLASLPEEEREEARRRLDLLRKAIAAKLEEVTRHDTEDDRKRSGKATAEG